jgi:hypothetical protein
MDNEASVQLPGVFPVLEETMQPEVLRAHIDLVVERRFDEVPVELRRELARSAAGASDELVEVLACDPDADVRILVAGRAVHQGVLESLGVTSRSMPADSSVLVALLSNPAVPAHVVDGLMGDLVEEGSHFSRFGYRAMVIARGLAHKALSDDVLGLFPVSAVLAHVPDRLVLSSDPDGMFEFISMLAADQAALALADAREMALLALAQPV